MVRTSAISRAGLGDQVLMWALTDPTRKIAERLGQPPYNLKVSHALVANFIKRQRKPAVDVAETRVAAIHHVTSELIKTEWAEQLLEAKKNYQAAIDGDDERGKAYWFSAWQRQIENVLKLLPVQPAAEEKNVSITEAFWKWLNEEPPKRMVQ